jgi:ribosomal protein S18 acetylase RimI-like enzyme
MSLQTKNFINLKAAQPEDASQIAPLVIEAGNGFYEFLFEGFGPESALVQIIEQMVSADKGPYGYQHYQIAERNGRFAGFVNAFPAKSVQDQDRGPIPKERWNHIAPMNEVMDLESFFLNSIGVSVDERRRGVGQALLKSVLVRAKQLGFKSVTLLVWEENHSARRLYERHGFKVVRTVTLAPHPKLPETQGLLMRCELAED